MATKTIPALPAASSVNLSDLVPISQSGTTKKATFTQIQTAIGGGGSSVGLLARYHLTANLTLASGSFTILNFTIQDYDPGSRVTTGAGWVFTTNATAWYEVKLTYAMMIANGNAWTDNAYADAEVFINGSSVGIISLERTNASDGTSISVDMGGSLAVSCASGDTIQVQLYNSTGAIRKLETDSAIEIYRVT